MIPPIVAAKYGLHLNCFAAEMAIKIGKKLNAADENMSNNMNHHSPVK